MAWFQSCRNFLCWLRSKFFVSGGKSSWSVSGQKNGVLLSKSPRDGTSLPQTRDLGGCSKRSAANNPCSVMLAGTLAMRAFGSVCRLRIAGVGTAMTTSPSCHHVRKIELESARLVPYVNDASGHHAQSTACDATGSDAIKQDPLISCPLQKRINCDNLALHISLRHRRHGSQKILKICNDNAQQHKHGCSRYSLFAWLCVVWAVAARRGAPLTALTNGVLKPAYIASRVAQICNSIQNSQINVAEFQRTPASCKHSLTCLVLAAPPC